MEQPELLIALSEKDLAIARGTKQLEEMSEKVAILELRHKMREIEALAEKAAAFVEHARAAQRRAEDEAASLGDRIEREQAKLLSGEITNHKEIQNLTRELDALRRQQDRKESDVLGEMEQVDAGEAQVAKIRATLEKAHAKEARLIAAFQERGGGLQREIETLSRERASLARRVSTDLLDLYERTREAKHGIAVGVLTGSTCGACRIELPAERVQAIRESGPIGTCPNCRRILVVGRS